MLVLKHISEVWYSGESVVSQKQIGQQFMFSINLF